MDEQQQPTPSTEPIVSPNAPQGPPVTIPAPQTKPKKSHNKLVIILAIILGAIGSIVVSGILLIGGLILILSGGIHSNKAQNAMKPIQSQLSQLHAEQLCDKGDNGYGIDNQTPWYDVYYATSNDTNLTSQINQIAADAGYPLQSDTKFIDDLKSGKTASYLPDQTYSTRNDYLTGANASNSSSLDVEVIRDGKISLSCSDYTNIQPIQTATPDRLLVHLSITFPERR